MPETHMKKGDKVQLIEEKKDPTIFEIIEFHDNNTNWKGDWIIVAECKALNFDSDMTYLFNIEDLKVVDNDPE